VIDFDVPDTRVAKDALELAHEHLDPAILMHSLRAFHIGSELGRATGRRFDAEALYVATLLHDLGFADAYLGAKSFEVMGADAARAFLRERNDARDQLIWDAIATHTVPHLALEGPPEVVLTHLGSASDAFGLLRDRLDPAFLATLHARYPRGDVRARFAALIEHHAQRQPFGQLAAFRALGLEPA
jgi:hypothetical protein